MPCWMKMWVGMWRACDTAAAISAKRCAASERQRSVERVVKGMDGVVNGPRMVVVVLEQLQGDGSRPHIQAPAEIAGRGDGAQHGQGVESSDLGIVGDSLRRAAPSLPCIRPCARRDRPRPKGSPRRSESPSRDPSAPWRGARPGWVPVAAEPYAARWRPFARPAGGCRPATLPQ